MDIPAWAIPLLIFSARICDVSIGTVRMIMVFSGHRIASAALGFIEVTIWVLAISSVIKYVNNPLNVLAFAGGFATGTLVGMSVEKKLALGFRVVRVINPKPEASLAAALREKGHAATRVDGEDRTGPVEIVFLTVKRKTVDALVSQIGALAPDAYVSIERAERVSTGIGPFADQPVGAMRSRWMPTRK
ncbi:MAG: DUF2179 domain-containing protein [Phycisphaeraceae bacterium]|nr:DUF2179 domain-containing protein [Phycisphaerales bacterium]MCB9859982.1 DUF2179 domain-containing protein [Phycisphaeraceae bacterium]